MKIKLLQEDEKLLAREVEIQVNNKRIKLPTKSIELLLNKKDSPVNLIKDNLKTALIEFRVNLSREQLLKMDDDEKITSKFISKLYTKLSQVKEVYIVLMLPIYRVDTPNFSKEEMDYFVSFLINLFRYSVVDLISVPAVIVNNKSIDPQIYLDAFLEPFLSTIFQYNSKKLAKYLVGYIPKTSHRMVPKFVETYSKHDITNFAVEFNGSSPINYGTTIEGLIRTVLLMEKEIRREGTFIHGVNVNKGLGRRNIEKIPAKDILSFCQGITSFSFPFRRGGEIKEEPKYRVFEFKDYGYYIKEKDELINVSQAEGISLSNRYKDLEKALNTKRLLIESYKLRKHLDANELPSYLRNKNEINPYLRKLQNFFIKIKKQKTLK